MGPNLDLIETDACGFYLLQQGLVAINIDGSGREVLGMEVMAAGGDREQQEQVSSLMAKARQNRNADDHCPMVCVRYRTVPFFDLCDVC